jgi:hypothetical protein
MSALSMQADELRKMAKAYENCGDCGQTSALLREAADTIISLRDRLQDAEAERGYWKGECAEMLSEFWDTESEHCGMLDYPRPANEPAPSTIVMASRMGFDQYRCDAEERIDELERFVRDMVALEKARKSDDFMMSFRLYGEIKERMKSLGIEDE